MNIITDHIAFPLSPSVATIGFFDGVHQGHRFLLEQVKEIAHKEGLHSSIITFTAHPRQILQSDFCPQLLSTLDEKLQLLETTGTETCILLPFTKELSVLSAKEFMQLLHDTYNVQILVIGYDHRFGHNRLETFEDYVRYGKELGMQIIRANAYTQDTSKISSSSIRCLLHEGNVTTASHYLGYLYRISGIVTEGYKIGRKIGFPTANISIDSPYKLIPAKGVYSVNVQICNQTYKGMLNIGHRPTLNNGTNLSIEVHIFNFSEDIYHQEIQIEFLQFIRPEIKFSSIEELTKQIEKDMQVIQCK
jgi:riboflavin kinase/FMN adenylyltransferase